MRRPTLPEKAAAMTTPAPYQPSPKNLRPEMTPSDQVGLCAVCHSRCHRYGPGGCPLCQDCQAKAPAMQFTHRPPVLVSV